MKKPKAPTQKEKMVRMTIYVDANLMDQIKQLIPRGKRSEFFRQAFTMALEELKKKKQKS